MMRRTVSLMALAAFVWPSDSRARPEDQKPEILTIHPAGEPDPALKYRLLPGPSELVPGNAALFYHRAIVMLQNSRIGALSRPRGGGPAGMVASEDRISEWINGPLDQIPVEEARQQLESYRQVLKEVELGARRETCDWGLDNRPDLTFDLLLPEIQETRSLARLVALKARLAVIDGDTDGAVRSLQTGFALARHVSDGPTLIQALVGMAIAGVMNATLEDLIQAPGTPCLYWALASRPEPFIDIGPALEGERRILERMVPGLEELDGPPWSLERGRRFLAEVQSLGEFTGGIPGPSGPKGSALEEWGARLPLAAIVATFYPEARAALIDSGMAEAEVEAMPMIQVVGLHAYRNYSRRRDDLYKWMSPPYWQTHESIDRAFDFGPEGKFSDPGTALFALLSPALKSFKIAQVRTDRALSALRCVEAIRLYAYEHDGTFLPDLSALTVPAPIDPATGEPFGYEVADGVATLSAPTIPGGPDIPQHRLRYELRLAD